MVFTKMNEDPKIRLVFRGLTFWKKEVTNLVGSLQVRKSRNDGWGAERLLIEIMDETFGRGVRGHFRDYWSLSFRPVETLKMEAIEG